MSHFVGLIGIGLMGSALAQRLIGSGFRVLGFDVDPARRKALEQMGGAAATSIASDRHVTASEAELFRVVAEWLDCPVPPLLPGQAVPATQPAASAPAEQPASPPPAANPPA